MDWKFGYRNLEPSTREFLRKKDLENEKRVNEEEDKKKNTDIVQQKES